MRHFFRLAVVLALSFAGNISAQATVLVQYNVNGSNPAIANAVLPIAVAPGVATASPITFTNSNGLVPVNFGGNFLWYLWTGTNSNRYLEWTVTPEAGHEIQYSYATLPLTTGGGSVMNWELLGSTDAFSSSSISFGSVLVPGSGPPNFFGYDISALGPQTGAVTFRLFGSGASTPGTVGGLGGSNIGGNNAFIEGTVTMLVPEPGTLALFGLGLAGVGYARRKRAA